MKDVEKMMVHHHRSSLKKNHKVFKSKHSSKGALKAQTKGRVEKSTQKYKPKHAANKQERRNKAKQIMLSKKEKSELNKNFFDGRRGAPRIVAVIPLCPDVDAADVVRSLNKSIDVDVDVPYNGVVTTPIDRFKQKIQYLVAPRHFTSIIDAAQVADFVVFVLSAKQEVDHFGETCLRSVVAQGVSTVYSVVQHLSEVESAKMQTELRKSLLSYMTHFFAEQEKIYAMDNQQECLNIIRSLCQQFPKGIQWRDCRAYILADRAWYDRSPESNTGGALVVEGVVRGQKLNPDRLVHIPGFGDFQVDKICAAADAATHDDSMAIDGHATVQFAGNFTALPTMDQDDLDEYSPEEKLPDVGMENEYEEPEMQRGVRLDDHFYLSDDEEQEARTLKDKNRIPKGMSEYQARWILEENSDDEYDNADDASSNGGDQLMELDGDDARSVAPTATEYGATEMDAQSEMFVDLSPEEEARQLKEYREREKEDTEFPDEVELPPEVSAKERFARYRGLRNLRASEWQVDEQDSRAPEEWSRLSRFQNFRATRNRVLKESNANCVPAGTRVLVYIRAPEDVMLAASNKSLFSIFALLRYEHKKVVLNVSATPNTEYEEPIPAKDSLILQVGARRYNVNPVFSESGTTPNNVYKLERFLHQGRTAIATMIAPVSFGNTPILFLKETDKGIELVASGSVEDADHSRVLAKRIILTGYPYKIHKRLVTVRYMFFNAEDIAWFKAVPLFTKMGRSGYIKESIGTHGYYKATFNGPINAQDTIAMALYKRVWPRRSELWTGAF
ncbi:hypothetical protein V1517DRAFT_315667 [Lipomyces orientalis]|uniref:Uncharacterized protein n=1 Tax=Lipomyces orientalis TaxID=1233043 RepID=A0ACC3TVK4_9ASCO